MTAPGQRAPWFGFAGWFLAALFFFYAWVLRVSPSLMVGDLMRDFQAGGAVLGNLSAFYFYAYAVLQMPAGLAHDRWGPRAVLTVAALVTGAGCLIFAQAGSIGIAYLGRFLIGAGVAFAFVGSLALAGAWFSPRRFALLSGLGMTGGLLGGFAGQRGLGFVVAAEGWRDTMVGLAVFALVLAALIWAITRNRPAAAEAPHPSAPVAGGSLLSGLARVAKRRQTLLIAGFAGLVSAPMLAFAALWGVPYTMQTYGLTPAQAASVISVNALGFAIGGPCWGWLSDRIGLRNPPMIVGTLLALAALTAAIYWPDLPVGVYRGLLLLNGFGGAAMAICYAAAREHNTGGMTGAAMGLVNTAAVGGGALFQPLIGWLLDIQWDGTLAAGARVYSAAAYQWAFALLPATYIVAVILLIFVRETRCRPLAVIAPAGA